MDHNHNFLQVSFQIAVDDNKFLEEINQLYEIEDNPLSEYSVHFARKKGNPKKQFWNVQQKKNKNFANAF